LAIAEAPFVKISNGKMVEGGAGLDPIYAGGSSISGFISSIRVWSTNAVQPSYLTLHMNGNMGGGTWRIGRWQNLVTEGEMMRLMTDFRRMRFGLGVVRAASRPIPPQWGSLRFRPLTSTYAPWGVRVDELAKSRKITHPKHFTALGGEQGLLTDGYYGYDVGSEMYGAPSFYTEYEAGLGQAVSDPARLAVDGAQEVI